MESETKQRKEKKIYPSLTVLETVHLEQLRNMAQHPLLATNYLSALDVPLKGVEAGVTQRGQALRWYIVCGQMIQMDLTVRMTVV